MVQLCALTSFAQSCVCKCGNDTASDKNKCYVILEQKDTLRGFCYCLCSQNVEANSIIKADITEELNNVSAT